MLDQARDEASRRKLTHQVSSIDRIRQAIDWTPGNSAQRLEQG